MRFQPCLDFRGNFCALTLPRCADQDVVNIAKRLDFAAAESGLVHCCAHIGDGNRGLESDKDLRSSKEVNAECDALERKADEGKYQCRDRDRIPDRPFAHEINIGFLE